MATETISDAISGIRNMDNLNGLDEARTKIYIVERLLEDLGWNLRSPKEVEPEYRVGKDKADYALNPNAPTAVFIEAKNPTVNLEGHQGQLLRYCFQQAVNLGVLTNGRMWWLYLPRYEGPQGDGLTWGEKRFCEIDITNGGPKAIQTQFEKFLAKGNVSSGEAVDAGKKIIDAKIYDKILKEKMVEAWNDVVIKPSEDLIKLFTDSTVSLCGLRPNKQQVKEFFQNHRFKVSGVGHPQPKPSTNGGNRRQNGKPSFIFNDTSGSARTWKQLLLEFCKLVYADTDRQGHFDQIINVRGTKTLYFSRNPADLKDPEQIEDSGVFAATAPLSAVGVKQRCQMVLREFDYREDSLKI